MILLVSGATATLRHIKDARLGYLVVPAAGNDPARIPSGACWACDNSAFSNFDPASFCRMLSKVASRPGCRFVAAPDVVGNARETAVLFYQWRPVIKALGLPVALVLQDGQEAQGVPWNMVDAVFVGGSTQFKLGPVAAKCVREAKRRGLWTHMGRVNTRQRFRYAWEVGCDSVDGSGFSRFPDTRIPMALRWMEEIERQPSLALAA